MRACQTQARVELKQEVDHAMRLLERPAAALVDPFVPPQRCEMLQHEMKTLDALKGAVQPAALRYAVHLLRATESNITFQAELLAAQQAMACATGYSNPNFAYGSTPLPETRAPCVSVSAALFGV